MQIKKKKKNDTYLSFHKKGKKKEIEKILRNNGNKVTLEKLRQDEREETREKRKIERGT